MPRLVILEPPLIAFTHQRGPAAAIYLICDRKLARNHLAREPVLLAARRSDARPHRRGGAGGPEQPCAQHHAGARLEYVRVLAEQSCVLRHLLAATA